MARKTGMIKLSEILRRLRGGIGANEIQRELGAHKTVIRRMRLLAEDRKWLDPNTPLPDEQAISDCYYAQRHNVAKERTHLLDPFKDDIRQWFEEEHDSFVVIRTKLNQRLGREIVKDTALRDYCHKHFPRQPDPVLRRDCEPGVAELDFGYLGKTWDDEKSRVRKTWFISVRFRFSRHAWRAKLFATDCETVIRAVIRSFEYFGAVPRKLVIDNFKAAISKANKTDPTITRTFYEFIKHYGILLSPCPPDDPDKKGGVETDIKYVKRNFWPLYLDREHQRGHEQPHAQGIDEYFETWNREIASVRPIREAGKKTPLTLFEQEYEQLLPLPFKPFEPYAEKTTILQEDWHVRYKNVRYSVPYKYIGQPVLIKANSLEIAVFSEKNELVALHPRSYLYGAKVTQEAHGPQAAIEYLQADRAYLLDRAANIGPSVWRIVDSLLADKVLDRLSSARGIVFLTKKYPAQRIENACRRALYFNTPYYINVKHILEKGLDRETSGYPTDAKGQLHFIYARTGTEYNLN